MRRLFCSAAIAILTSMALPALTDSAHAAAPPPAAAGTDLEWKHYASDRASTKYLPASLINRDNAKNLDIAWRWDVRDADAITSRTSPSLKNTPLMVDGKVIVLSGLGLVTALDAATGKKVWTFDSESYNLPIGAHNGFQGRGVEYWENGDDKRLIYGSCGLQLVEIDLKTGKRIESFGEEGGYTDLAKGLGEFPRNQLGLDSPPIVCGDTIIVGSMINDYPTSMRQVPGHVRGYDVRTGKLKWMFHTIPQAGEFGNETWEDDSWKYTGNTNVWSMISVDEELGLVYLPVSTPTNDYYGGHRPGNNLFAESLVCVKADTGERVWHFQAVHHGLWDYDFPCAPNLVDVTVNGQKLKLVAQVSKQGFTYVFNRVTGEPIWPIVEKPVPASKVPGEKAAATQPFPTKPPAFELQGVTEDTVIDFTPELKAEAIRILQDYEYGPIFTPPINVDNPAGKRGVLQLPGTTGGANWPGAAVDPETGILYVQSFTKPIVMTLIKPTARGANLNYVRQDGGARGPQGLPLVKPPWGRITAIDLKTGNFAWQKALGDSFRNHEALRGMNLPPLGSAYTSGLAGAGLCITKTLLFSTQAGEPERPGGPQLGFLRAIDKATGDVVFERKFDNAPTAPPMTYVHNGKQYIVTAAAGRGSEKEFIAFSIP